ncbi:MAG TPA: DUF2442 domain-containing protein [Ignavibacteria bacterium]|nr:DUF2442 domain-containing protein [Ignavibacteria bacterium]
MENIHVKNAEYLEEYKINVEFNTGLNQVIDLKDEIWEEIFEPLKDKEYFRNFKLNPFTIYWENGADFSPEYLFEMAKKQEFMIADKKRNQN